MKEEAVDPQVFFFIFFHPWRKDPLTSDQTDTTGMKSEKEAKSYVRRDPRKTRVLLLGVFDEFNKFDG